MTLPKKSSRGITIDGNEFRWLARATPQGPEVRVEHSVRPASQLVARIGAGGEGAAPIVGPGLVAALVRQALASGWSPSSAEPREFLLGDQKVLVDEHDLRSRRALSCLIIAPFDAGAARLRRVLAGAVRELGVQVLEASDARAGESLASTIAAWIADADFVVADVSRQNPDVFYELGFARALGKPTFLLVEESTEASVPSSLAGNLFITYSNQALAALGAAVQRALLRAIRSTGTEA